MSDTKGTKWLMEEVMPKLTEEGKGKVRDLIREYGIGDRDLTEAEVDIAGSILSKLITRYTV